MINKISDTAGTLYNIIPEDKCSYLWLQGTVTLNTTYASYNTGGYIQVWYNPNLQIGCLFINDVLMKATSVYTPQVCTISLGGYHITDYASFVGKRKSDSKAFRLGISTSNSIISDYQDLSSAQTIFAYHLFPITKS